MNCPKCKDGVLQYNRRGQIDVTYATDKGGKPVGEPLHVGKCFELNLLVCTECDYTHDTFEDEVREG